MGYADWFGASINILKIIRDKVWSGITWPWRIVSSLPDWVKGLALGILIILAAYIFYRLYKSWGRQEYRFIQS